MIFLQQSSVISNNTEQFNEALEFARFKFQDIYKHDDFTKFYHGYNVFTLTATDSLMYALFKELQLMVRSVLGDQPLWLQCWMNYHRPNEVLDWHSHEWPYHGYISVEPKKTNTVFADWTIENKPAQVYFGEGQHSHKVEVLEDYEGYRTTLGFDVTNKSGERSKYVSFIPF